MPDIDWRGFALPKPEPRERTKRRVDRQESDRTKKTRTYVFQRDGFTCRCCSKRRAESMHEIRPRSLRGPISRENSCALCGDGSRGCHGFITRHEIVMDVSPEGADGLLVFCVKTERAAEWVGIEWGTVRMSAPMFKVEA